MSAVTPQDTYADVDATMDGYPPLIALPECAAGIAYSNAVPQPGMAYSHHKSDRQRFQAAWHAAHCRVENCEWCHSLCADGHVIACDECGHVQHTDWLGWEGEVDDEGHCFVFCPECAPNQIATQTGAQTINNHIETVSETKEELQQQSLRNGRNKRELAEVINELRFVLSTERPGTYVHTRLGDRLNALEGCAEALNLLWPDNTRTPENHE